MESSTTKVFVLVMSTLIGLSIFTMTNSNVFAQQNGFTEELNLLNQTIPALENQDKNAKKTLFDAEEIMEEKLKDNQLVIVKFFEILLVVFIKQLI